MSLSPQRVAQKRTVSKIWTISCDNPETVRDVFRLIPTSMTWMTLGGVIALILRFSPNSIALLANYVTVIKDRPIISVKYCLPDSQLHPLLAITHPAGQSLCDSWATCFLLLFILKCRSIPHKYCSPRLYINWLATEKMLSCKSCHRLAYVCLVTVILSSVSASWRRPFLHLQTSVSPGQDTDLTPAIVMLILSNR